MDLIVLDINQPFTALDVIPIHFIVVPLNSSKVVVSKLLMHIFSYI